MTISFDPGVPPWGDPEVLQMVCPELRSFDIA
jgi:hypothetical protein